MTLERRVGITYNNKTMQVRLLGCADQNGHELCVSEGPEHLVFLDPDSGKLSEFLLQPTAWKKYEFVHTLPHPLWVAGIYAKDLRQLLTPQAQREYIFPTTTKYAKLGVIGDPIQAAEEEFEVQLLADALACFCEAGLVGGANLDQQIQEVYDRYSRDLQLMRLTAELFKYKGTITRLQKAHPAFRLLCQFAFVLQRS